MSVGLETLRRVVSRGVASGEFRQNALIEFPQLIASPVLFSLIYKLVFEKHQALDTDRMLGEHVEMLLVYMRPEGGRP